MKNGVLLILVAVVLCSCPRPYETEGIGQSIVGAPEGFEVLNDDFTSSGNNLDFTTDVLTFDAVFNSTVTGFIDIVGLGSGAERHIIFEGDKLDANTLQWYGEFEPGTNKFFGSGEQVVIKLSFYNSDVVLYDTITITKANDFMNSSNVIPVALESENGFESALIYPWGVGSGVSSEAMESSPEGNYCVEMSGSNSDGVWVTYLSYGDRDAGPYLNSSGGQYYPFTNDASQLWFNVYVYGDETNEAELYVSLLESDQSDQPNNNADEGVDDAVQIKLNTSHKGWKLFSYRYNGTPFQNYCIQGIGGGGCGDKIYEPHRIRSVSFDLQTESLGQEVSVKFDYPMFTIGGPFDPVKFRK